MTDDRSLERAARSWLDEGPTAAPDRPVEAALARIQAIPQERDLRVPWIAWRPKTMFGRLAVAAVAALVTIGTFTLGASLLTTPDIAAGPCPATFDEVDAIDTFGASLSQAERSWSAARTGSGVRAGYIAGFASTPPDNVPGTVVLIDPERGTRCRLIELATQRAIGVPITSLDWSPSGEALAIALAGHEPLDGSGAEDGVVLLWTPDRLLRIWKGEGSARLEWAPDGGSIAVWSSDGSQGPDGTPDWYDTRVIFADGSPDRTFDLFPVDDSLRWSRDGSRWVVAEAIESDIAPNTAVSIVDVADGRQVPLEVGTGHFRPIWWSSNDSVALQVIVRGRGVTSVLDVPIADPPAYREFGPEELPGLYAVLAPDGQRFVHVVGADERGVGDLRLGSAALGTREQAVRLAPGAQVGEAGFAWSPDGSRVVFQVLDGGLWVVNDDGTGLRQVASAGIVAFDDPWQPVPVR